MESGQEIGGAASARLGSIVGTTPLPPFAPSLPLDCLASTYHYDFRIQNQADQLKAPAARPSQPVHYESTAISLRLRNRSISASIEPNRVPQLNTFGVRPPWA
jgi:hypothetical protein